MAIVLIQILMTRLYNLANRPFAQPYLTGFGYGASHISFFYSGFIVVSAVLAKTSHRVSAALGSRERLDMTLVLALAAASIAAMAFARIGGLGVAALAGVFAANGLSGPMLAASLNRRIGSKRRATVLSMASMGEHFLGMLLGPLYGYLSDALSLAASLRLFFWSFGPLLALCAVFALAVLRPADGDGGRA